MGRNGQDVLELVLGLPEDDRMRLAEALLRSLAAKPREREADESASRLDRRLEEALHEPQTIIAWAELKSALMMS